MTRSRSLVAREYGAVGRAISGMAAIACGLVIAGLVFWEGRDHLRLQLSMLGPQPLLVNDVPYVFSGVFVTLMLMVDTGASFVTLTTADAARVGVDVAALRFGVPIRTANGTIQAAPVTVGKLAVGSIERTEVPALVAPSGSLDQSLLGMSFLNTLDGYAISGDRLVLTP